MTTQQIQQKLDALREEYKKKPDKVIEIRGKLLKRALEVKETYKNIK